MANRKPLVQVAGELQQLQTGDTLTDGAGNPIGGGSVPTGTGFRHVTASAEDAAVTTLAPFYAIASLRL
jgi:hypothetical protein